MRPRSIFVGLMACCALAPALAQQAAAPPPLKTFATSAEVAALVAKARADRKEGQNLVVEPVLSLAPYRANLEYRTALAPAAVHEQEAELFYVLEGTANMITGGKLVDEKRTNAANLSGSSIVGGQVQAVARGDFLIVPENTPHQVQPTGGAPVVLVSLHVPRGPEDGHAAGR